jgi:mannose-6-phosphate isomerase-like protein (cupin superfamily)
MEEFMVETKAGRILRSLETEKLMALGVEVEVLLSSDDTAGAASVYRLGVMPQGGPPLHFHADEDEAFYVLDGDFEVTCGDTTSAVSSGEFVFLPRQIPHTFRNAGDTMGRLLGICTPGGHENFFRDAHQLGATPSMNAAIAVCVKNGIHVC